MKNNVRYSDRQGLWLRIFKYKETDNEEDDQYLDRRIRRLRIDIAFHLKTVHSILCREQLNAHNERDIIFLMSIVPKKITEYERMLCEYIERDEKRGAGEDHSITKQAEETKRYSQRIFGRLNSSRC